MGYPIILAPLLYILLWCFIIVGSMGFFKNGESQARNKKKTNGRAVGLCLAVVSPAVALSGCSPALPESFQVGNPKITKKTYMKKKQYSTLQLVYVRALVETSLRSIYYKSQLVNLKLYQPQASQNALRNLRTGLQWVI